MYCGSYTLLHEGVEETTLGMSSCMYSTVHSMVDALGGGGGLKPGWPSADRVIL